MGMKLKVTCICIKHNDSPAIMQLFAGICLSLLGINTLGGGYHLTNFHHFMFNNLICCYLRCKKNTTEKKSSNVNSSGMLLLTFP